MIVSEVRVEATSLCLGAGRYPLPMGSQPDRAAMAASQRQSPHALRFPDHWRDRRSLLWGLELAPRTNRTHSIPVFLSLARTGQQL